MKLAKNKRSVVYTLIILSVLAVCAIAAIRHRTTSRQEAAMLVSSRNAAEKISDERFKKTSDILQQLGIAASEVASSKNDVCYVASRDHDMFVRDWYQACYLRYTSGFTTTLSKEQLIQKLKATPLWMPYSDKEHALLGKLDPRSCKLPEIDRKISLLYRPSNLTSDDFNCGVPNQIHEGWTDKRLGRLDASYLNEHYSVHTYQDFQKNALDSTQNQIWIVFDAPYFQNDVGCGLDIVFCGTHRTKPVHPPIR